MSWLGKFSKKNKIEFRVNGIQKIEFLSTEDWSARKKWLKKTLPHQVQTTLPNNWELRDKWIAENINDWWYSYIGNGNIPGKPHLHNFRNAEDAMLFKLVWG